MAISVEIHTLPAGSEIIVGTTACKVERTPGEMATRICAPSPIAMQGYNTRASTGLIEPAVASTSEHLLAKDAEC